jgi:hypothetical protein
MTIMPNSNAIVAPSIARSASPKDRTRKQIMDAAPTTTAASRSERSPGTRPNASAK